MYFNYYLEVQYLFKKYRIAQLTNQLKRKKQKSIQMLTNDFKPYFDDVNSQIHMKPLNEERGVHLKERR